mgnify:CR=1 FL=1
MEENIASQVLSKQGVSLKVIDNCDDQGIELLEIYRNYVKNPMLRPLYLGYICKSTLDGVFDKESGLDLAEWHVTDTGDLSENPKVKNVLIFTPELL